ncbi:MAG: two-component regulator propeller domain-containing protein, partial [Vicinamibacterales bacterium]
MRKATLALLLVIGAAAHGQAQRARPEPIRFDHLSVEQGLSQSIVRAVLHDAAGFLWFATHDGLNQYDGYRLTIYRHEPDNPNSLPSSVVMSLAEQATPGGAVLWIGTNDGLAAFHAAQDRFTRYLPGEVVPALHVDRAGVVWAGTGRGIRRFDGSSFQPLPEQDVAGEPNVATDAINTFADAGGGALWVGTVRGLARIDARGATAWRGLEGEYIRAIVPDRRGRVWVATDASGILRLNLAAGRIDRFRAGDGGLTGNSVNALLEDTDGDLWAGVWGGGLVRIVEAANGDVTFLSYRHDAADPSSLGIDDLNALAQDRSGVVWVGTYGAGLSRFHPQARKRFAHFKRSTAADDLRDDRLFALLVDRSGVLWAGTWLGVDRFVRTGPGIGDY